MSTTRRTLRVHARAGSGGLIGVILRGRGSPDDSGMDEDGAGDPVRRDHLRP